MLWNYILNIRLGDNVIYKRDLNEDEISPLDDDKFILDKNDLNCEILSNVEVLKDISKHLKK